MVEIAVDGAGSETKSAEATTLFRTQTCVDHGPKSTKNRQPIANHSPKHFKNKIE